MESQVAVPRKLWEHPDPKSTLMYEFMQDINQKSGQKLEVGDVTVTHYTCSAIHQCNLYRCDTETHHWTTILETTQSHCLAPRW